MYIITGGAGFIGSNIAASLDADGADIVIIDWLGQNDYKWRNICKRRLFDIVTPESQESFLAAHHRDIRGVFHMGAISTTTETNVDAIVRNNFRLSIDLWTYCARENIPLVYASSAATYGDGSSGFDDCSDVAHLAKLRPLNAYGWSKNAFDRWVAHSVETGAPCPPRWAGLKFFNVYGPNEFHKGEQRSVAVQLFEQIRERGAVRLFRSDNPEYADGEQLRDFVWVDDCVNVARWAMQNAGAPSGVYNVGSGAARSFLDMARIIFHEMDLKPKIEFIDLPPKLQGKYQYHTCASMTKLRTAGYDSPSTSLEDGLRHYIRDYLTKNDQYK